MSQLGSHDTGTTERDGWTSGYGCDAHLGVQWLETSSRVVLVIPGSSVVGRCRHIRFHLAARCVSEWHTRCMFVSL